MSGDEIVIELFRHHFGRPNGAGQHRNINQKLDWIIDNMATKAQLDAALQQLKQDVADAAARAKEALANLQAKIDAGENFDAELAAVNAVHDQLSEIASAPAPTTAGGAGDVPPPISTPAATDGSPHPLNTETGVREPAAPDTTPANDPFAHAVPTGAVVAPENQTPPLPHQVQPGDTNPAPAATPPTPPENKDATSVVTAGAGSGPEIAAAPAAENQP